MRLPTAEIVFDLPSRLADRLSAGELDIALVPSIALAEHPEWTIVSDACIGCRGPVLSVKLMFRVPPAKVRWLALDEGSRTSAVLAQILLHQLYGIRPALTRLPIGDSPTETNADAVLVIGDRAISNITEHDGTEPDVGNVAGKGVAESNGLEVEQPFIEVWDLGDRWCRWSELPFVFAMWVARPGFDIVEVAAALSAARDDGCRELAEITRQAAAEMELPAQLIHEYLQRNLYFRLDSKQREGLDLFYRQAADLGLISAAPHVTPDDCPTESR
jgi:chorismate dehydratase